MMQVGRRVLLLTSRPALAGRWTQAVAPAVTVLPRHVSMSFSSSPVVAAPTSTGAAAGTEAETASSSTAQKRSTLTVDRYVLEMLRDNRVHDAILMVEKRLHGGLTLDPEVLCHVMNVACENGRIDAALTFFDHVRGTTQAAELLEEHTWANLVQYAARHLRQVERAFVLVDEMTRAGWVPVLGVYNTLLEACAKSGQLARGWDLLRIIGENNLRPSRATVLPLVRAHIIQHDAAGAVRALVHMKSMGLGLENVSAFTNLLACAVDANYPEAVPLLLDVMQKQGHRPDSHTYLVMLRACTGPDAFHQAMEILTSMKDKGVQPVVFHFNALINICVQSGDLQQAFSILEHMAEYEVVPDHVTLHTLLKGCINSGWIEGGFRILEQLDALPSAPVSDAYSLLLRGCIEHHQFQRAMSLCKAMEGRNMSARLGVYSSIMEAFANAHDFDGLYSLHSQLAEAGYVPNQYMFKLAIFAALRANNIGVAKKLAAEMEKAGYSPIPRLATALKLAHAS